MSTVIDNDYKSEKQNEVTLTFYCNEYVKTYEVKDFSLATKRQIK